MAHASPVGLLSTLSWSQRTNQQFLIISRLPDGVDFLNRKIYFENYAKILPDEFYFKCDNCDRINSLICHNNLLRKKCKYCNKTLCIKDDQVVYRNTC